MQNLRLQKGEEIANKPNQIERIDDKTYKVKSQSSDFQYDVVHSEIGWICSCPDHMYRGVTCKHIYSVEISLNIRKVVEKQLVIPEIFLNNCPQCQSTQIVKHGIRHNKYGDVQRFSCLDCKKRFSDNIGFERMKASPQVITSAMQLYFTGESFRNVQKFLRLQGVDVSHMAVYKWINKYVGLMQKYLDTIKPNVSNVWRTDELYLKVKGNNKFLFALMDDETRFWIAQQIADKKYSSDIRMMFRKGIEVAGKKPSILISDGANNFVKAYRKEYWTKEKENRTKHIRHVRFQGDVHNNKMERLNGEIRDREKTMRGIKKQDTPILSGYQIFHNYIREHEALDNITPAEACGIKIEGNNKWRTLIQNATKI
jgi:transposase-like protein